MWHKSIKCFTDLFMKSTYVQFFELEGFLFVSMSSVTVELTEIR
jgi:hypothetical protein